MTEFKAIVTEFELREDKNIGFVTFIN